MSVGWVQKNLCDLFNYNKVKEEKGPWNTEAIELWNIRAEVLVASLLFMSGSGHSQRDIWVPSSA